MGNPSYNFNDRSLRTANFSAKGADGNYKVGTDALFEQNKVKKAHDSMLPNKANKAHLRESRDSANHPNSVPIIIVLDVTGSMGDIPEHLIREGLPNMVAKIMEQGIADPQILIMAVGDSRNDNDNGVFQLGQFESGDVEMDLWLQRIWISGKGGGNGSESYNWAYFYANNHIQTDAWEKRKQKGFIFTIGDDHCQPALSSREIQEYMGEVSNVTETVETPSLVKSLQEKWHIYHLNLDGSYGETSWKNLLGNENVITCGRKDYDGMANKIAQIVGSFSDMTPKASTVKPKADVKAEPIEDKKDDKQQVML